MRVSPLISVRADHHEDGGPGEVADEEGLGEQVGDDAQAEDPGGQAPESDDQAQGGGERGDLGRVGVAGGVAGQWRDGQAGEEGDRRLGADGEDA